MRCEYSDDRRLGKQRDSVGEACGRGGAIPRVGSQLLELKPIPLWACELGLRLCSWLGHLFFRVQSSLRFRSEDHTSTAALNSPPSHFQIWVTNTVSSVGK